ncbi:MAG TPA: hypothetical protein VMB52_03950 [Verrucomicrobiae bacterium]|nr:hypothetical protein [Verrucomicrobiae bacterium]
MSALARVIGDALVHKLSERKVGRSGLASVLFADTDSSGSYNNFLNGPSQLLDEAATTVISDLQGVQHPYRALYELQCETDNRLVAASERAIGSERRHGTQFSTSIDTPRILKIGFSGNYKDFIASLLIMYGVAVQAGGNQLPEATELDTASAHESPYWVALLTQNRHAFFGRLFFGQNYYGRFLDEVARDHKIPSWITFWSEGINKYTSGQDRPFEGCTTEAPLLYAKPSRLVSLVRKNPGRCAGQIPLLSADQRSNDAAVALSRDTNGIVGIESNGRFSAGGLLVGIGRAAAVSTLFGSEECRDALLEARLYCDTTGAV